MRRLRPRHDFLGGELCPTRVRREYSFSQGSGGCPVPESHRRAPNGPSSPASRASSAPGRVSSTAVRWSGWICARPFRGDRVLVPGGKRGEIVPQRHGSGRDGLPGLRVLDGGRLQHLSRTWRVRAGCAFSRSGLSKTWNRGMWSRRPAAAPEDLKSGGRAALGLPSRTGPPAGASPPLVSPVHPPVALRGRENRQSSNDGRG
jgi:hypothetical protein